jgi:hypothetical protein
VGSLVHPTPGQADAQEGQACAPEAAQVGALSGALGTEAGNMVTVPDAPPLAPAPAPEHSVPASATVRAHPVGYGLVAVPETWVSYPISEWHILLGGVGFILEAITAWLSFPGFILYFPGWWAAAVVLCGVVEGGKFIPATVLAALWHRSSWVRRMSGYLQHRQ